MPDSKKPAKSYADLTLIQLKTFADRGDVRAQHELDQRMGGPKKTVRSAPPSPPPPPLRSVSAPPREHIEGAPEYTSARQIAARAQAANTPFPKTAPDLLDSQRGGLMPPPLPDLNSGGFPGSMGGGLQDSLLYDHLPPGQTMSPALLARLQDIANKAPEPEEQPPVVLGSIMLAIGVILVLFGFSVTRGETGTWYYVGCGLALTVSGWLYLKGKAVAWLVYAATCVLALLWAIQSSANWLEAALNLMPFVVIAGFAFAPSTRDRLGLG